MTANRVNATIGTTSLYARLTGAHQVRLLMLRPAVYGRREIQCSMKIRKASLCCGSYQMPLHVYTSISRSFDWYLADLESPKPWANAGGPTKAGLPRSLTYSCRVSTGWPQTQGTKCSRCSALSLRALSCPLKLIIP